LLYRNNIIKILAIFALFSLVLVATSGCQNGQTQETSVQPVNDQGAQQTQVSEPKVLFFTADY